MRFLLTLLLIFSASQAEAAITYIAGGSGANSGGSANSGSLDTTGGDFIIVDCTFPSWASTPTPSDNKSNSFTQLSITTDANVKIVRWYCAGATCGTSHTITVTGTEAGMVARVFAGVDSGDPIDQDATGTTGEAGNAQPGSITPTNDNSLLITCLGTQQTTGSAFAINSSFATPIGTDYVAATSGGIYSSYLIQTSKTAVNPTWTWTGGLIYRTARMTSINAASGGSVVPAIVNYYRTMRNR